MTDASVTGTAEDRGDSLPSVGRLALVVALVSGAVLLFELSLMRLLLVAVAHHFAFLVISVVLLGYGASGDAANIVQPTENADGAQRCMRLALADAELQPGDVDYLNPHATSTPAGDVSEVRAIRAVFGNHVDQLPVSATKSMTGHLLGAAGAVEALLCIRALETGVLPPTINLTSPDPECELDHVANKARQQRIRVAVSNSFGFGGTNATLVLGGGDV